MDPDEHKYSVEQPLIFTETFPATNAQRFYRVVVPPE